MEEKRRRSLSNHGSGGGVSSQLVFQTQSVNKQGKERDFIDLHLNDNEITTPMLPPGEYQLLLEGLRLFTGMLGKGIGVVVDYSVCLIPASSSHASHAPHAPHAPPSVAVSSPSLLEKSQEEKPIVKELEKGRINGSVRHPEFRKILDFRVGSSPTTASSPSLSEKTQPTGAVCLQIKAKRYTKTMTAPRLRARLIRRMESAGPDKGLPNTFDPLASTVKTAVEELFGTCRPDIGNMLQNLYKNSTSYRADNALQAHRLQVAHSQDVWWPKEGEELWSERTRMSYTLNKKIGEGGYGVAFLSNDFYGQRYVAKASKTFFSKEKVEKEWRKETKLMLAVQHPNVVQLYDAFTWSGLYWVIIEECEGSFAKYVSERGCLSSLETISVAGQLLSALEHIHSRGIIHRDVQMDNVLYSTSLFTKGIIVKLTDFGISKFIGQGSALVAYTSVGRAYDMSPEVAQMEGGFTVGVSDVYQLGLVLYNVLTGKPALSEADGAPLEAIHSGLARERAENIGTQLGGVISMMLRRSIPHRLTVRDAWLRLSAIRDNPDAPLAEKMVAPVPDFSLNVSSPSVPERKHARKSRMNILFKDYHFEDEDDEDYGASDGKHGGVGSQQLRAHSPPGNSQSPPAGAPPMPVPVERVEAASPTLSSGSLPALACRSPPLVPRPSTPPSHALPTIPPAAGTPTHSPAPTVNRANKQLTRNNSYSPPPSSVRGSVHFINPPLGSPAHPPSFNRSQKPVVQQQPQQQPQQQQQQQQQQQDQSELL